MLISKNPTCSQFESEFCIPLNFVALGFTLFGVFLIILSQIFPSLTTQSNLLDLSLLFISISIFSYLLETRRSGLGRWFLIIGMIFIIYIGNIWFNFRGLIALMIVTQILSILMIGISGALFTTIGESIILGILLKLSFLGGDNSIEIVTFFTLWIAMGVFYLLFRSICVIYNSSVISSTRAENIYKETLVIRERLEQMFVDLSNANKLLLQANKRADMLREAAEEAQKAKSIFVAKVSHEFRTPLNMIIGLIELMVDSSYIYSMRIPPDMENDLQVALRNCKHLSEMIDDVLDLTRIGAGQVTLHKEWVDLSDIIKEAITLVKPLIDKKKLFNHVSIPSDPPKIYCDRTRIRQVILNLVSNAARFTELGGITINLEIQNQQVVVGVSDTGSGIAPHELDQIFEPFCQGSNNFWREKGGSGLGLSISKQFVELHGGQMWVKSELNVGSSFLFSLPISTTSFSPIPSSSGWIREDWVWYENSFKSVQPFISKESLKPRIALYDETDGINSELPNFQEGLNFFQIRDFTNAAGEIKENPPDLVMINTLSPDHLLDLIEQARLRIPRVPIIGSCLPKPVKLTPYYENVQYLTKPVTISKLKDTILKIKKSVEKVLIIDDDPEVLGLLRRLIKVCDDKVEVLTASDGIEGLEQLNKFVPDLILLDLVMPRIDGWQFLEHLKSNDTINNLPVIVISAKDILEQPLNTNLLIASINDGLSIKKLLGCSLYLTPFLTRPDALLDLAHLQTADA